MRYQVRKNLVGDPGQLKFWRDQLVSHFGNWRPTEITSLSLADYMIQSQRRLLEELRATVNLAEKEKWIPAAPKISMPPKYRARDHFLTEEELEKLIKASEERAHLHLFILIAITTGARRSAILELKWDTNVNLKNQVFDFNNPDQIETNKRRPVVPIAGNLMPVLERAKSLALSDYVIEWNGKPIKRIDTALEKAAKRAGVRCTAHILKHSAISYMAEQNFTVGQIAEFTETTAEVVGRVYMKVNPKGLIAISEGMNKLIPSPTQHLVI